MLTQIILATIVLSGRASASPLTPAVIEATIPCPWRSNFSFDEQIFISAVSDVVANLTNHVYLFGTAGEGYALDDAQFVSITSIFAREMRRLVGTLDTSCVGIMSLSLRTVQERIEAAAAIGIQTFQLTLPSWQALSDDEVFSFFKHTVGRYKEYQFWHYNNPKAKKTLNATHYGRLSTAFPNFVGVKTCNNDLDWLRAVAKAAPHLRLFPNELGFALAKDELKTGLLISTASTSYARAHEFFVANATERMAMYNGPITAINNCQVSAAGDDLIDGAYDKQLSRLHAPSFPARLLPPYTTSSEESFWKFVSCVCKEARTWLPSHWCPSISGTFVV